MSIVFIDKVHLDATSLKKCLALGVRMYDNAPINVEEAKKRVKEAEILVASFFHINRELIDAAPQLKYIIVPGSGWNHIDEQYARKRGVTVLNCPESSARAVAEHAIALMLAVKRCLVEAAQSLQAGQWRQLELTGTELYGKRLGLIGYGAIGKLIAQLGRGLGMITQHVNSKSSAEELRQLLRGSDIVCACLPLTPKTHYLLGSKQLRLLKKTAILINISRGAVIDQGALRATLKRSGIAGTGLDVFEDESDLAAIQELATLPNVVATPHIAYNTQETILRRGPEVLEKITACIKERTS